MTTSVDATVQRVGDQHIHLAVESANQCARCARGVGCGMGLFGPDNKLVMIPSAIVSEPLEAGDCVSLSCESTVLLSDAVRGYGLPLIGLVGGASVASMSGGGDLAVALAAFGGALVMLFVGGRQVPGPDGHRRWKLCKR